MLRGIAPLAGMSTDEDLSEGSARRWTSSYRRRLATRDVCLNSGLIGGREIRLSLSLLRVFASYSNDA